MKTADLGYHASDLLQANCIVWVEGPSDRIYLNHWIRAMNTDLVEGLHYSIMFYGGRLLSHLTANDPEVDDFIKPRTDGFKQADKMKVARRVAKQAPDLDVLDLRTQIKQLVAFIEQSNNGV